MAFSSKGGETGLSGGTGGKAPLSVAAKLREQGGYS